MTDEEHKCFHNAVKDVCQDNENYRKNWIVFRQWQRPQKEKWMQHLKAMAQKDNPMAVAILTRTVELRLTSGLR